MRGQTMRDSILSSEKLALFDARWAAIALFATLVSAFSALALITFRLGLVTSYSAVFAATVILAASTFAPLLLPRRGIFSGLNLRAIVYPLISLLVLASVLLAFRFGQALLPLYPVLALCGMARAFFVRQHSRIRGWIALVGTAAVTAAYLFIFVNNLGYVGVYTPEQGLLGLLNHDTRFHTAVTFLIQNFGTPSLGVDGMLPLKYHVGSHVWFAAFGLLAGVEPLWSYTACVLLLTVPGLVVALIFSGMAIDLGENPVAHYLIMGLALLLLSDAIGWNSYYISETYTFGLIGLLLSLPLLMMLTKKDVPVAWCCIGFATAMLLVPLLMSLKISIGVLWGVGVGWIALRRFGIRFPAVLVGIGCLTGLLIGLKFFSPGTSDYVYTSGSLIAPFYILRAFPHVKVFSSFIFPLCLVLLTLSAAQSEIRTLIKGGVDIPVETVAVVTIIGALPPFLGVPQDSAVWYFLNVGQWLAMALLISRVSPADFVECSRQLNASKLARPLALIGLFLLAVPMVESIKPAFQKTAGDIVRAADQQNGDFLKNRLATRYFLDTLSAEHTLFGSDFRKALPLSTGAQLIAAVRASAGVARSDFAVFIPPGNTLFWQFQEKCLEKHNVQPALTGQPSLFGAPPKEYGCIKDAYQADYGTDIDSRSMSDSELCKHAVKRNMNDILVLETLRDPNKNRILKCSK